MCLGIMAFAVTLWVTETVPFAVTSLLVVLLIPVLGVADFRSVVRASFGDPHHRVLPRRADAVGGVHSFGPRHAPGLPDPGACGHAHRSRAAGRADRGHLHLVVDHGHGRSGDAAAARRGSAARCGSEAWSEPVRAGAHDRHGIRTAHRWHRNSGRHGRQPGRHRSVEAAGQPGRVVRALDALRRAGLAADDSCRVAPAVVALPTGTRTPAVHARRRSPPARRPWPARCNRAMDAGDLQHRHRHLAPHPVHGRVEQRRH